MGSTVWTLVVPLVAILMMKKLFKALGFGNLLNPMEALALATAGGGKLAGSNDAVGLAKGMKRKGNSKKDGEGKNKKKDSRLKRFNNWRKGNSFSRRLASPVKAAKGLAGFADRVTSKAWHEDRKKAIAGLKSRAAEARKKRHDIKIAIKQARKDKKAEGGPGRLKRAWREGRAKAKRENKHAGLLSQTVGGLGNILDFGRRENAEMRLATQDWMQSKLAAAGVRLGRNISPELAAELAAPMAVLHPSTAARQRRALEAQLDASTFETTDPAKISMAKQGLIASLEADFKARLGDWTTGQGLTASSRDAIASHHAKNLGVAPHMVKVGAETGVPLIVQDLFAGGATLAEQQAMLASAPTWFEDHLRAAKPGESEGDYADRMVLYARAAGVLDAQGGAVDIPALIGLDSVKNLNAELAKTGAGLASELDRFKGALRVPEDQVRLIDAHIASRADRVNDPVARVDTCQSIRKDLGDAQQVTSALTAFMADTQSKVIASLELMRTAGTAAEWDSMSAAARAQTERAVSEIVSVAGQSLAQAQVGMLAGRLSLEEFRDSLDLTATIESDAFDSMRDLLKPIGDLAGSLSIDQGQPDFDRLLDELKKKFSDTTGVLVEVVAENHQQSVERLEATIASEMTKVASMPKQQLPASAFTPVMAAPLVAAG